MPRVGVFCADPKEVDLSLISGALRVASTSSRREVLVSGLLALLLLSAGSGSTPLIGQDESRFAVASQEMLERGDLVVPTFAGEGRYDKPILIYWCTMISYQLLGVSERAARLPSQLAGALVVALLAWTARRRWGAGAGLLAGMLLLITPVFNIEARACTADLVMLLPTIVAMLALEQIYTGARSRYLAALFWIGMALSVLAKGPVGPACALFTGVALWAVNRSWKKWELIAGGLLLVLGWWPLGPVVMVVPVVAATWSGLRSAASRRVLVRLRWQWGLPLAAALVAPWAIAAHAATDGAFFAEAIGRHVVSRSLIALESHGGFPGFYIVTGLIVAFPWVGLLPSALRRLRTAVTDDPRLRFLIAWLLGPLVLLELIQTKLVHYWMISYPAGVMLVVGWLILTSTDEQRVGLGPRLTSLVTGLALAFLPLALVIHLNLDDLKDVALLTAIPLILVVLIWTLRGSHAPLRSLVLLQVGTVLYLLLLLATFLPAFAGHLVGPRTVQRAAEKVMPNEQIVVYKARDDELFFYLPEAISCRSSGCLREWIEQERPFLGLARTKDLEQFKATHPDLWLYTIETVEGIDLGHLETTEVSLVRTGASYLPAPGAQP
jgi:4-amino-4-deoxy-L-arabinose transferase-like glycosyltransferase